MQKHESISASTSEWRPCVLFPLAATLSGVASGVSCGMGGLGIFVTGLFFGIAIVYAVKHSLSPLSRASQAIIVASSTIAFWFAIVAFLLAIRFLNLGNNMSSGVIAGFVAGSVGSGVVATALVLASDRFQSIQAVVATVLSGGLLGSIQVLVGVYVSDYTPLRHPLDDMISLPIWQAGVASVLSWVATTPEAYQDGPAERNTTG